MIKIYDLMYCGEREIYNDVAAIAVAAGFTTEDGSDEIHPYRLVVKGEQASMDDYLLWVMRERLVGLSMHLETEKALHPDNFIRLAKQVIAEFKAREADAS